MTAILSMPSVSATVRRSSANCDTVSYWYGVDEPIPGRSIPIRRMLASVAYSRASIGICRRAPGVPCSQNIARPCGAPNSAKPS